MSKYPRKRDDNEKEIIAALRARGASVQQIDAAGVPDLLVGLDGVTHLLEVKQHHGKAFAHAKKSASGLLPSQDKWWSTWKGREPMVVTTPVEALQAVGL